MRVCRGGPCAIPRERGIKRERIKQRAKEGEGGSKRERQRARVCDGDVGGGDDGQIAWLKARV